MQPKEAAEFQTSVPSISAKLLFHPVAYSVGLTKWDSQQKLSTRR